MAEEMPSAGMLAGDPNMRNAPEGVPGVLSLGMRRVRAAFNPSENGAVDAIKRQAAALIDYCEKLKATGHDPRLCSLAQTAIEEGAMWAVKAATDGGKP